MPIDLAKESEDPELMAYFTSIMADLQGKKGRRWNVNHESHFVLPEDEQLDQPKLNEDDPLDFEFEVSSHPLPPQFKLYDQPGKKFVLVHDLKKFTSMDSKKIAAKFTTLEMKKEDFVRRSINCLVGAQMDPGKSDLVVLVQVDPALKKLMGIDDPKLFQNPGTYGSPSKGKKKGPPKS